MRSLNLDASSYAPDTLVAAACGGGGVNVCGDSSCAGIPVCCEDNSLGLIAVGVRPSRSTSEMPHTVNGPSSDFTARKIDVHRECNRPRVASQTLDDAVFPSIDVFGRLVCALWRLEQLYLSGVSFSSAQAR
ncbi:hypothetical protein WOLCODRAFT_158602 [Wolfiporia cocos MD-104 SS10]|uniref:Hydrophobin n=1 Tax=Wolfiporia cocos (strain MD-104) TaxID=742152 RepID=A0A2H3JJV5_WOLCO|nr:hypothetical protein WOLCODRAFT_158602 [Wolfiporia cocos MD-104 SS10]